jgi:hypothetical protein
MVDAAPEAITYGELELIEPHAESELLKTRG